MKQAILIFTFIYTFFSICALLIGVLGADSSLGGCNKHPTILGKYTGLSFTFDIGCKLGERVEE